MCCREGLGDANSFMFLTTDFPILQMGTKKHSNLTLLSILLFKLNLCHQKFGFNDAEIVHPQEVGFINNCPAQK